MNFMWPSLNFSRPRATLKQFSCVPPEKFSWFNREAEQLNSYLRAYVNHNINMVLIDIISRIGDENVEEYYESPGLLHPNRKRERERGHPIIHDLAEPWHQGVRGMQPYIAEYEAGCPKEPSQLTKDSSRVKFLASAFMDNFNQKAAKNSAARVMTRDAAEDLIYDKRLQDARRHRPLTA